MPRFKSINDFRSPQTDRVLKDFFRLLRNLKVINIKINRLWYLACYIYLVYYLYLSSDILWLIICKYKEKITKHHFYFFYYCTYFINNTNSPFSHTKSEIFMLILIYLFLIVSLLLIWIILSEFNYFTNIDITTFLVLYFVWL